MLTLASNFKTYDENPLLTQKRSFAGVGVSVCLVPPSSGFVQRVSTDDFVQLMSVRGDFQLLGRWGTFRGRSARFVFKLRQMFATSCPRTLVRALSLASAHVRSLSLGYMYQSIALAIFCVWYAAGVLIGNIRLELSALRYACKGSRLEQFIQKAIV